MIKAVFLWLGLPLLVVFTLMALVYRKKGLVFVGILMSNLYFLGATEGLVYLFNRKVGLGIIGLDHLVNFFVNPFKGRYQFFWLNFKYNQEWFIRLWLASLAAAVLVYAYIALVQLILHRRQAVNVAAVESPQGLVSQTLPAAPSSENGEDPQSLADL